MIRAFQSQCAEWSSKMRVGGAIMQEMGPGHYSFPINRLHQLSVQMTSCQPISLAQINSPVFILLNRRCNWVVRFSPLGIRAHIERSTVE